MSNTDFRRLAGLDEGLLPPKSSNLAAVVKAADPDDVLKLLNELRKIAKEYIATAEKLRAVYEKQLTAGIVDLGIPISDIYTCMNAMFSTGGGLGYEHPGPVMALQRFDHYIEVGKSAMKALKNRAKTLVSDMTEAQDDATYEREKREKTNEAILMAARAIWQVVDPGGSGGRAFQSLIHTIEMKLEKHIHDIIDGIASGE